MTKIPLQSNANEKAKEIFKRKNLIAARKAVEFHIKNNHKTKFATELQIYVTKIGLALQECVEPPHRMKTNTYLGSIEFICKKILSNTPLYNIMRAIEINSNGNTDKHNIKDIDINIDFTLKNYNMLISEIVKNTGLSAFKTCYLNKPQNSRDIPIVDETRHHKYFIVGGVNFQLKLNERYEVDPYSKTISSKITLYWPEGKKGNFVSITVKAAKSGRTICAKSRQDISQPNSKVALKFKCSEDEVERRVLYLTVTIKTEVQDIEYAGTTGILFWKEDHYKTVYKKTGKHTQELSQFFSKNHEV